MLFRFWQNEDGATAIEYCLIAGIISIAILAGVTTVGVRLQSRFFLAAANGLS